MPKAKPKTAKKKPSAKQRTLVTFLLDRSGSMESIKSETIEGFNSYLTGLRENEDARIDFTFLQFDTGGIDRVHVNEPIQNVPLLSHSTFIPRGGTPLIDAAYRTIEAVADAVSHAEIKPKVVICIQTDGEENNSREHNWSQLSALVKAKQELGWQFNFLGAGIDAYEQGAKMGIAAGSTVSYNTNMASTRSVFMATAQNLTAYAVGATMDMNYSDLQKQSAGDVYDKKLADALAKKSAVSGKDAN